MSHKPIITLLAGGTGVNSLAYELTYIKKVDVRILLNAYDDGKSTGLLRKKFNMLGPSDIMKNITFLINPEIKDFKKIQELFELRLPHFDSAKDGLSFMQTILSGNRKNEQAKHLRTVIQSFDSAISQQIFVWIESFLLYMQEDNENYDLSDHAFRNLFFVAEYRISNKDYQSTIEYFRNFFHIPCQIIINSNEQLWLYGKGSRGSFFNSEASIVSNYLDEEVKEIFLLKNNTTNSQISMLHKQKPFPRNEAIASLKESDAIIFAPTTFASSIWPTLLTRNLAKTIIDSSAYKIWVANTQLERSNLPLSWHLRRAHRILTHESKYALYEHQRIFDAVVVPENGKFETQFQQQYKKFPIDRWRTSHVVDVIIDCPLVNMYKYDTHVLSKHILNCILGKKNIISKKNILNQTILTPFLDGEDKKMFTREYKEYTPKKIYASIIAAAGKQTRFDSAVPKVLFPINGKCTLERLHDILSSLGQIPFVVVNKENKFQIDSYAKNKQLKMTIVVGESNGSGGAVITAISRMSVTPDDLSLLIFWSDTPFIKKETILQAIAIYEQIEKVDIFIPSSWEKEPYAGLERDEFGRPVGLFQTKNNPTARRSFGEHDASFFIVKVNSLLRHMSEFNELTPTGEFDLNQMLSHMIRSGAKAHFYCNVKPYETISFNSLIELEKMSIKESIRLHRKASNST